MVQSFQPKADVHILRENEGCRVLDQESGADDEASSGTGQDGDSLLFSGNAE